MNAMTSGRLEIRWVPVQDDAGRTRMQASWVPASTTTAQPALPAHAA